MEDRSLARAFSTREERSLAHSLVCVFSRKRLSGTLKVERGLHTERSQDSQHKIGRNILRVPVENGRNTRPRRVSKSRNLVMSQAPLSYDLDYLVVQVTTDLNFEPDVLWVFFVKA